MRLVGKRSDATTKWRWKERLPSSRRTFRAISAQAMGRLAHERRRKGTVLPQLTARSHAACTSDRGMSRARSPRHDSTSSLGAVARRSGRCSLTSNAFSTRPIAVARSQGARDGLLLAATAQNLRRLGKWLTASQQAARPATTSRRRGAHRAHNLSASSKHGVGVLNRRPANRLSQANRPIPAMYDRPLSSRPMRTAG